MRYVSPLISDVAPATDGWETSVVISNAKALTNSRRVVSSTTKGVENAASRKCKCATSLNVKYS